LFNLFAFAILLSWTGRKAPVLRAILPIRHLLVWSIAAGLRNGRIGALFLPRHCIGAAAKPSAAIPQRITAWAVRPNLYDRIGRSGAAFAVL